MASTMLDSMVNQPVASVPKQDGDIARRVAEIVSTDSPLTRQARTQGTQMANRRGLLNSSMGIGAAYDATVRAATPIATQESQQANARDMNVAQIAASERQAQLQAYTNLDQNYSQAFASINNINDIKAADRAAQQAALRDRLQYGMQWMQNLYGVGAPAPSAPSAPAAPAAPIMGIGSGYGYYY